MANRWGNNGNSERLFSCAPKSLWTVNASHEIKRCLLLRRKAVTNLDSVLKSRDITMLEKVCVVQAVVFPVVKFGCASWTIKKAEPWIIDAFELWCWRRLESPLDSKEINPVNPKGIQSWILIAWTVAEAPILWPPDTNSWLIENPRPWCWERLKAKEGGGRGWDGWVASPTQWSWIWANSGR